MSGNPLQLQAEASTHAGHRRKDNEDALVCEPSLGLYGVFDGMGGHMAGDVASQTARDLVVETVRGRASEEPAAVLKEALTTASRQIFEQAQGRRDRHGMGTTAVVAIVRGTVATIAHVGDSRAYLLRGSRLQQMTADHTVVAAMLAAGAITPEESVHHPYKNVLSRCLGNQPEVLVEVQELPLLPGDRLLLCSDGLNGFAAEEAIEQILRGAEDPASAVADLIEAALRGGGGDNVTAVVLASGGMELPQATVILRESGAHEWWRRRELFLAEARTLGAARSPICANLPPEEALEVVAGSLCEAVFFDLQQTSGINAWTYGENLARGWLERGGEYEALRELLDLLREAAKGVLADIAAANASFAAVLEVEVTRSLIVVEKAVAGVIAEFLRQLESQLMLTHEESFRPRASTEQPTVPYLGGPRTDVPSPHVQACLHQVFAKVETMVAGSSMIGHSCLRQAHELAYQSSGGTEVLQAAQELCGEFEQGTMPVFEALEQTRELHLRELKVAAIDVDTKAEAMRRLALAYQSLAHGIGILVVDSGRPITDDLREMAEHTARMREQVRRKELRVAELEARLSGATVVEGERNA